MLAEKASVGKLIICHYSARYDDVRLLLDEAKSIFPKTYLAHDAAHFII